MDRANMVASRWTGVPVFIFDNGFAGQETPGSTASATPYTAQLAEEGAHDLPGKRASRPIGSRSEKRMR